MQTLKEVGEKVGKKGPESARFSTQNAGKLCSGDGGGELVGIRFLQMNLR